MAFWSLNRHYRHIQRYRRIAEVLIKNGFGYLIDSLDLYQFLPLRKRFNIEPQESNELSRAKRLRLVLEELGPTFIKLGQLLSTRPDLIPQNYIEELTKLQDEVPSFEFESVIEQVEKELDCSYRELFTEIEKEPLAAASIGQVHKAYLKGGQKVVIKVQRPNIRNMIQTDLDIIFNLAKVLKQRVFTDEFLNPVEIAKEFDRLIKKELNYEIEGKNTDKFRENFADDKKVKIPKVHWDFSTKKLLVLEYIDGVKLSKVCKGETKFNRKKLAKIGAESFMKQILIDGYFHGDPHPGNMLVTDKEQLAYLDFGIVGRIDQKTMEEIANIFLAVIRQDEDKMLDGLLNLGVLTQQIDERSLKRDINELLDEYYGVSLQDVELSRIINQMLQLAYEYRVELPSDFILLGKSLITLEGVGTDLDPEFNAIKTAKPFAYKLLRERLEPKRLIKDLFDDIREFYDFIINFPEKLDKVLRLLENRNLRIELKHLGLDELISKLDIVTNRLSISVIIAALIVGSSLVMQIDKGPSFLGLPMIGLSGYLIAGFFGILLIISIIKSGRF
ncbi:MULTISPECIES: ABC1 kinase family protein [unclassified Candidatus Frackibacter]|uniref:ABC1 kinase family protein n=1 Tax=unclassified Candidatus Frackibacter TaxID=2648818 RepID=UPI0007937D91|nr:MULTISPECIES: AarF/ABC1/UbiB kinase family protein [unclassified Candidatus Frackibacter]KXS44187.1 MAG: ubiquinone biosynthesis protein [Candidatus Frackibacter sp. T328-2]SDC64366.1 2-octaprenylphenol hydroxylase [Candidatus Frackibacter sp. WG11]SEM77544.1 2-octaprenylphenol hydroxylase [Candidatus Frackibacter sp. WG12]SFL88544.1 2-octaprenylphenol hydroxylase [Candidatus Frackibacter sp. WG13]